MYAGVVPGEQRGDRLLGVLGKCPAGTWGWEKGEKT